MPPRGKRIAAAVSLAFLAACDHPVRPAAPAPLELAAEHAGVTLSTILELRRMADRVQPPSSALPRPNPAGPEAQRLRETVAELEKRYRPADAVTP